MNHKKSDRRSLFLLPLPQQPRQRQKKYPPENERVFNLFRRRLSTQAEFGNDCTVAVDVTILQVVEE